MPKRDLKMVCRYLDRDVIGNLIQVPEQVQFGSERVGVGTEMDAVSPLAMALLQPPLLLTRGTSRAPTALHSQPPHRFLTRSFHHPATLTNCNFDARRICSLSPKPPIVAERSAFSESRISPASGITAHAGLSLRGRDLHVAARASKSDYTTRRVLPFRALLAISAGAAIAFLRRWGLIFVQWDFPFRWIFYWERSFNANVLNDLQWLLIFWSVLPAGCMFLLQCRAFHGILVCLNHVLLSSWSSRCICETFRRQKVHVAVLSHVI